MLAWLACRTFGERHSGVLGVDGVQDSLIANLGLGDQADFTPDVRRPSAHPATQEALK